MRGRATMRNQIGFDEAGGEIIPVSKGSDGNLMLEQATRAGVTGRTFSCATTLIMEQTING